MATTKNNESTVLLISLTNTWTNEISVHADGCADVAKSLAFTGVGRCTKDGSFETMYAVAEYHFAEIADENSDDDDDYLSGLKMEFGNVKIKPCVPRAQREIVKPEEVLVNTEMDRNNVCNACGTKMQFDSLNVTYCPKTDCSEWGKLMCACGARSRTTEHDC